MFKRVSVLLVFSSLVFADDFNISLNYQDSLRIPSLIEENLQLGQLPDCNCEETTGKIQKPASTAVKSISDKSAKVIKTTSENIKKKSGVYFEVTTPALAGGNRTKLRTTLSTPDLNPLFNSTDPGNLSETSLLHRYKLNSPKQVTETALEFATRAHIAITTVKAAHIGKTDESEALNYIKSRMKGKSFKSKLQFLSQLASRMLKNYDWNKTVDNGDAADSTMWEALNTNNQTQSFSDKAESVATYISYL